MSDLGSSNTIPALPKISAQLPREKPATSDLEKFKRIIQKQINTQSTSSSEPQDSSSPTPTNTVQQNHIPYNPNHQSIPHYLKERQKEKEDENNQSNNKEDKKKQRKQKIRSRKNVTDQLEQGMDRIKNGCNKLLNGERKRRRLRL